MPAFMELAIRHIDSINPLELAIRRIDSINQGQTQFEFDEMPVNYRLYEEALELTIRRIDSMNQTHFEFHRDEDDMSID